MKTNFKILLLLSSFLVSGIFNLNVNAGCAVPALASSSFTVNSGTSVTFNWVGGSAASTGAQVWVYTTAAMTTAVFGVAGAGQDGSYTRTTSLVCNTTYYVRMRGTCSSSGGGVSTWTALTSFTTGACATCFDGIQNGTETGVDCGGSCAAVCPPPPGTPGYCEPCGAGNASSSVATLPTVAGVCQTISISNTPCAVGNTAPYTSNLCGIFASGADAIGMGQYRTWLKLTVPASGIIRINTYSNSLNNLQRTPGCVGSTFSSPAPPSISLYGGACGAGPGFTTATGGYLDCGRGNSSTNNATSNATIILTELTSRQPYGTQFMRSGLTPGATVYACIDYPALGGTACGGSIDVCVYDGVPAAAANFIGSSPNICGGPITTTTNGSMEGLSLCEKFKPPSCGSGPAPSFENATFMRVTSDAAGNDITVTATVSACVNSAAGVQLLVYEAPAGFATNCAAPECVGSGGAPCRLGACLGGSTASGMGVKTVTVVGPTPNTDYFILIDGFAGAMCNFTVEGTACVILPMELDNLSAEKIGENDYNIFWATRSERDSDYFLLERSDDGENWDIIAKVDAAGSSSTLRKYNHLDYNIENKNIYYRLKLVDYNGSFSYTKVIVINNVKDSLVVGRYNLLGQEVSANEKGLIIIRYADGSTEKYINK